MGEIELLKNIDFQKGFANFHFVWPMDGLFSNGTSIFDARFDTQVMGHGLQRPVFYSWKVIIDDHPPASRWFGLELVTECEHPMPILYRFVVRKQHLGVRLEWGGLHVIRNTYSRSVWHSLLNEADVKKLDGTETSLHIFLAIPISACDYPIFDADAAPNVAQPQPFFGGGQRRESNLVLQNYANLFETRVIRPISNGIGHELEGDPYADADEFENDPDPGRDFSESDFLLKVIKNKKTVREFNCHKLILAAQSQFFARHFRRRRRSTYRSGTSVNNNTIEADLSMMEIDDSDGDAIEVALRFIYTGVMPTFEKPDTNRSEAHLKILNITAAAVKFELGPLKDYCSSKLIFGYTSDEERAYQLLVVTKATMGQLEAVCMEQLSTAYALFPNAQIEYAVAILATVKEELMEKARGQIYSFGCPISKYEKPKPFPES